MDLAHRARPHWPTADLIERFDITLPDGTVWEGSLHRTRDRTSGRRIIVRDGSGMILHDTDECYDLGNARNGLELWLAEEQKKRAALATQAEELALVEEAERQMEPHDEDAHADSAPHG